MEIFSIHLLGLGVYFWKDTFMLEGLQNRISVFKCPRTGQLGTDRHRYERKISDKLDYEHLS